MRRYEFIFVLDGPQPDVERDSRSWSPMATPDHRGIPEPPLRRSHCAHGRLRARRRRVIVTLPAYLQIEGGEIAKLVSALDSAGRCDRSSLAAGAAAASSGCGAAPFTACWHGHAAANSTIWAAARGHSSAAFSRRSHFTATSIAFCRCSPSGRASGRRGRGAPVAARPLRGHVLSPRELLRSFVLDIFTVFFLVRFTKRPLRFFGMVGATMCGSARWWSSTWSFDGWCSMHRLADRPALLLSSLLVVLGLQLFALGLLGELIIFTHARHIKDYQAAEIIEYPEAPAQQLTHEIPLGTAAYAEPALADHLPTTRWPIRSPPGRPSLPARTDAVRRRLRLRGVLARFIGLGRWPLAIDEYYFAQSVQNILHFGLPATPAAASIRAGCCCNMPRRHCSSRELAPELAPRAIAAAVEPHRPAGPLPDRSPRGR